LILTRILKTCGEEKMQICKNVLPNHCRSNLLFESVILNELVAKFLAPKNFHAVLSPVSKAIQRSLFVVMAYLSWMSFAMRPFKTCVVEVYLLLGLFT